MDSDREKVFARFNELARDNGKSNISILLVDGEMRKQLVWAAVNGDNAAADLALSIDHYADWTRKMHLPPQCAACPEDLNADDLGNPLFSITRPAGAKASAEKNLPILVSAVCAECRKKSVPEISNGVNAMLYGHPPDETNPMSTEQLATLFTDEETLIAKRKAVTGRTCGSCSMCCKLLGIPEIGKLDDEWCPHCRPGKGGCSIYQDRPAVCRKYSCLWLVRPEFDDHWFPKKCGIVADWHQEKDTGLLLRFHVDPRVPNRWREEPYYTTIKRFSLRGLRGVNGTKYQTIVTVKGERTLILPHRETPYTPGVILRMDDDFEFLSCASTTQQKECRPISMSSAMPPQQQGSGCGISTRTCRTLLSEDPEFIATLETLKPLPARRAS
jgi:hypothetical protein